MENKRKALGKGLEQLFSNEVIDFDKFEKKIVNESKDGDIIEIPLSEIRSNPYQPRKEFDEEALKELADSIKEHGIIQPIIVKKSIKGYEIVAGERRTRASKMAGKTTIPAIIKDYTDQEMMEIALAENILRQNLNPIEEAEQFKKIIDTTGNTQEEVAKKFGKSRSYITNLLGLLDLPDTTKNYVTERKISMGHARVLSKISDENKVNELANKIIEDDLSVRDTEKIASSDALERKNKINRTPVYSAKHAIYEGVLREKIGTKVKINNKKIEIPFDSDNDLDRILEILGIDIEGE
jgi:ParB family chromosome partitioning protein